MYVFGARSPKKYRSKFQNRLVCANETADDLRPTSEPCMLSSFPTINVVS